MLATTKTAQISFNAPKFVPVTAIIDFPGITTDSSTYGGWETIARPENKPIQHWVGLNALQLNIPVLFDELDNGHSLETRIQRLERMAGISTNTVEIPPEISLKTIDSHQALIPRPDTTKWIITGIDWGDSIRRRSDGHRIRQAGTVTLMEHVEPSVKILSASRRAGNSRRHTTHVVKKGETMMKVSILEYGTADRWQDIAKANSIHDPRNLKPGTKLKLPK